MIRVSTAAPPLKAAINAVRRHLIYVALFSALLNLLMLAPTLYMLQVYDRVVPTHGGGTLFFLTLVLLFALGTMSLLDYIRSRLLVRASATLDRQLSGLVLDSMLATPPPGMAISARQAIRDFDQFRQALAGSAIVALFDAPWSLIYILVCFLIHPALALMAIIGLAIVLAIAWVNDGATRLPMQRANEAASRSYISQEQASGNAEVIRALGMRGAMVQRNLRERASALDLQAEASFASGRYTALSKFFRTALQSLALGLGALLAIDNKISGGAIFASSLLIGRALSPADQIVGSWRSLIQARTSFETLNELFSARAVDITHTQLPAIIGRVSVEKLIVLNPARDVTILGDVSLRLEPGEAIAVVGPSGGGKSTLARALAGGLIPDRGSIRFDGAERRDWDQERLARFVGYLPQDATLFEGSVKENIARFSSEFGDLSKIDELVVEAAQLAGVHDLILSLPGGYDSPLGWGGRGLSAGQSQRIALARAMFGNPRILILDEPNAHLDAAGEASLVEGLRRAKEGGASVLMISHRTGVLSIVDKVLVLNNGKTELFGPRDEVLQRLRGDSTVTPITKAR